MKNYSKARKRINVSVGESVRIMRELQELSQNDLAELTGIPQSTISSIENDGTEKTKELRRPQHASNLRPPIRFLQEMPPIGNRSILLEI